MQHVMITEQLICVEEILKELPLHPCCGTLLWFAGIVRDRNRGQGVREIHYECYESMARQELEKIVSEVKSKWEIHQIAIAHRMGRLSVGEVSLIVVTSSPHRDAAFAAIRYVVDELKKRAPIWKKEIYETGDSQWLQ